MEYKEIFEKAYELMDQPIVEGNCGELCDYHCCRSHGCDGNKLGMYLIPLEFELMQESSVKSYEIHPNTKYFMPPQIKKLYYIFCDEEEGCFRNLRPIQCRTYPFEPHIEDDELYLVIEEDQFHSCPLLSKKEIWRWEFVNGIYKGWELLIKIPKIKYYITELSKQRTESENISEKYNYDELNIKFLSHP